MTTRQKIDLVYIYHKKKEDIDNLKISKLKFSISTALKFLQCLDKIFIVTENNQVHNFKDILDEKIVIMDHSTLIPQKYLPTFNSETTESYLHCIPHLSEYFLFNKKYYPFTDLVSYGDLITTNGKFNFYNSPIVDRLQSEPIRFLSRVLWTKNLLKKLMYIIKDIDFVNDNHCIKILRKNTLRTIEIIFSEELHKMRSCKITTATMFQYMYLAINFDHMLKKNHVVTLNQ